MEIQLSTLLYDISKLKNITIFEQSKGAVSALRGPIIHNS